MSRLRLVAYAAAPLIGLLALTECVAMRTAFRDANPDRLTALGWAIDEVDETRRRASALETMRKFGEGGQAAVLERLYDPGGDALLAHFRQRYRARFAELARSVGEADAKLVVLYVPPSHRNELARRIHAHDLDFFEKLALEHGATFVDSTPRLMAHAPSEVSYLPEDFHLTRFGNRLLAQELVQALEPLSAHRSATVYPSEERPSIVGDLPPDRRELRNDGARPYVLETNAQGLRRDQDLSWPRDRDQLRILLLGDSYTFGLYMAYQDTYGAQLEGLLPRSEVLNAGALGYTIEQEADLFDERARWVEPDIVVLQVLFNDLVGLFAHERRLFLPPRLGWFERRAALSAIVETEEERAFLATLGE